MHSHKKRDAWSPTESQSSRPLPGHETTPSSIAGITFLSPRIHQGLNILNPLDNINAIATVMPLSTGSEELLVNLEQRDDKNKEWLAERSQVQKKLEDEIDQHGDIHLVETIDTYENLPLKVLLFHKWYFDKCCF